jgi:hypothetical protein
MDGDDLESGGGLTVTESQELASLESEIGDTRGRHFQGHHGQQYWHSVEKQTRHRELLEKREAANKANTKSTSHLAKADADARIEQLIRSADYWKNPAAQAEVNRLIQGQMQDGKAAPVEASPEVVQAWAKALDADSRDVQVGFDRVAQLERSLTRDSVHSFDGLSDATQAYCLKALLPGADPQAVLDAMPADARAEFLAWEGGLTKSELAIIRQMIGRG